MFDYQLNSTDRIYRYNMESVPMKKDGGRARCKCGASNLLSQPRCWSCMAEVKDD